MRALELTVYPEGGCVTSADCALKQWCVECVEEQDKRFTDAELAAEYLSWDGHLKHLQWCELASGDELSEKSWKKLAARSATLHKFATLPHYDEAAA